MPRNVKDPKPRDDKRHSRWDAHREARRAELVDAAVAAIDEHGPSAGIAEIAASAGVSKPVLYRYFTDKDDLYRAVGAWGANAVIEGLLPALLGDGPIRGRVEKACDDYLQLISLHPHVFFLLVEHPTNEDPLADGKEMVAATISRTLGDALRGSWGGRSRCRALVPWSGRPRALHRRVVAAAPHDEQGGCLGVPELVHLARLRRDRPGEQRTHIDSAGRLRLVSGEEELMTSEPSHEPAERYDGPAHIGETEVEVRLRGHFQPIDGLFHWWGRIGADTEAAR